MELHQLAERVRKMLTVLGQYTVMHRADVGEIHALRHFTKEDYPFVNGGVWGDKPENDWIDFFFTAVVPDSFRGKTVLRVTTGREGTWEAVNPQFAAYVDGRIAQAFDTQHTRLTLDSAARPGTAYRFEVRGYSNLNRPEENPGADTPYPPIFRAELCDIYDDMEQLIYDIRMPYEAAMLLPELSRERETTLIALSDTLNRVDLREPFSEGFFASVKEAREFIRVNYYEPLKNTPAVAQADIIGHTHIDVAWLWDLYQTRHKAVRSFSTVLKLMEQYPEYKFMSSQAQLYEFVRQDEPELFSRIQQCVADGRWQVEGGMWVEADCNLTGSESLVRQFLYGNEFFIKYFGKRSRILWLPDVFGYSAALPQILKKSGIDYFFTSKLSWSEFNKSPYDTFRWKGVDGTEVLTHFTPSRSYGEAGHAGLAFYTTYNAMIDPDQMKGGWQRFQQKGLDDHFLVSYGYGDGGGGPTEQMLENARRLSTPLPGVPQVRQTFPTDFFDGLEERVGKNKRLPKWQGELYLEYHRGTYTAMAQNKRFNRKTEILLRETEMWTEYAHRTLGIPYPNDELRDIWHDVLTLQFHDILPGSSIKKVYDDSREMYTAITEKLNAIRQRSQALLAEQAGGDLAVFNSLGTQRDDIVWFDCPENVTHLCGPDGALYPVQRSCGRACAFVCGLVPTGVTPFRFVAAESDDTRMDIDTKTFDTPFYSGTFDASMRITSLTDKRCGRQLVKEGEAFNRIVCYENLPHNYDAWDINIYYNEHSWEVSDLVSARVTEAGPVLTRIACEYRYLASTIRQDIVFYRDIDRIDFETKVDWQQPHYLLKAHFPVDLFYTEATYDIQFGNVKRPTHRNTSWDVARFEVCAHKWIDVSEGNYGFSLLNDCKYGHSADENGIALTLLKSSTYPNPKADIGEHTFTYSILPHMGDWRVANTPLMSYMLNIPVTTLPAGGKSELAPFAASDCENVVVETVKRSLAGDSAIIRLYENYGQRTEARVKIGVPFKTARLVSLMEDDIRPLKVEGDEIALTFKPYEILTIALD